MGVTTVFQGLWQRRPFATRGTARARRLGHSQTASAQDEDFVPKMQEAQLPKALSSATRAPTPASTPVLPLSGRGALPKKPNCPRRSHLQHVRPHLRPHLSYTCLVEVRDAKLGRMESQRQDLLGQPGDDVARRASASAIQRTRVWTMEKTLSWSSPAVDCHTKGTTWKVPTSYVHCEPRIAQFLSIEYASALPRVPHLGPRRAAGRGAAACPAPPARRATRHRAGAARARRRARARALLGPARPRRPSPRRAACGPVDGRALVQALPRAAGVHPSAKSSLCPQPPALMRSASRMRAASRHILVKGAPLGMRSAMNRRPEHRVQPVGHGRSELRPIKAHGRQGGANSSCWRGWGRDGAGGAVGIPRGKDSPILSRGCSRRAGEGW